MRVIILSHLDFTYFVSVSTFYTTREALGAAYNFFSLEYIYGSMTRDKDKILHIRVINIIDTSNKALVAQQKDKTKHPKK